MPAIAKSLLLAITFAFSSLATTADDLKIEHVANAGVRISSGDQVVLIDALFGPHSFFNSLDEDAQKELTEQGADIALSTHAHADHFGADRTAEFLEANPQTLFIGTPRMMELLKGKVRAHQATTEPLPVYGSRIFSHNSINVEVLNFPHMMPHDETPANYAYIVEMNGWRALHVGDAGMTEEAIRGLKLSEKNLDIAIIHDLFPVHQENYKELIDLMGVNKVAFMHMLDEKAAPMAKWISENLPGIGSMLVTGYEEVILKK